MSAGRYLKTAYSPGQRLSFGSTTGTVVSVDTAMTVLEREDGSRIHVPNTALLGTIVTVEDPV